VATAGTVGSSAVLSVLGTSAETALLAAAAGLFPELALQGSLLESGLQTRHSCGSGKICLKQECSTDRTF